MTNTPILEVDDLKTWFHTSRGVARAVDGVSFSINAGEVLGLVGESGCGKSVTSLSILGLVPRPGRIEGGTVKFKGTNLLELSQAKMEDIRGDQISMIFQQPQSALNPVYRAGDQIAEVFEIHENLKRKVGTAKAVELLERVGIPDPGRRSRAFPHELSGGMAQRVMIAMALALEPALLIADEPTTALDVTIQAQILDLMRDLQRESGTAVLLITHDLGIVAEMADRVAVMYAGQIVEAAPVRELFAQPRHPYTEGLIGSVPILGQRADQLTTIPGVVPHLIDIPPGCRFSGRCSARLEANLQICLVEEPELKPLDEAGRARAGWQHNSMGGSGSGDTGHLGRCWLHQEHPTSVGSVPPSGATASNAATAGPSDSLGSISGSAGSASAAGLEDGR